MTVDAETNLTARKIMVLRSKLVLRKLLDFCRELRMPYSFPEQEDNGEILY